MLRRFFNWLLKMENATGFDVDNMEWFFNFRQGELKMTKYNIWRSLLSGEEYEMPLWWMPMDSVAHTWRLVGTIERQSPTPEKERNFNMYYYNEKTKIIINLDSILYVEKDKYHKNTIAFYMKNPERAYTQVWVEGDEAEFQKICNILLDMNTKA